MDRASQHNNHYHHVPSTPISKIFIVASIAAGVQFGWALQLSLLTPYVQLLGVPHMWAAFIWLCGPISGLLVQPIVGYYSDRCHSRFGRRRPFIVSASALVSIAVIFIGFAADIGMVAGDKMSDPVKPRAVAIFVVGFWILDVANNTLQGPCRALLADLSNQDHHRTRTANAAFSFFIAVGNILGYAAGSYTKLYTFLPFTRTDACDIYCANLKSCFIIGVVLLMVITFLVVNLVEEKAAAKASHADWDDPGGGAFVGQLLGSFKSLSKPMWILLVVTALNWTGWFGFLLFDTDWMGKEVYGGDPKGSPLKVALYDLGVRSGSLGLMINAAVLGVASIAVEPMARLIDVNNLWGGVNFILAICLALTVWITKVAEAARAAGGDTLPPPLAVKVGSLALFGALGIPMAITFSIPFALASIFSSTGDSGAGQGLSMGVLNMAIVIPQMIVSVASGPLDAMFGGGNLPVFVLGAIAAALSGILALTILPKPIEQSMNNL